MRMPLAGQTGEVALNKKVDKLYYEINKHFTTKWRRRFLWKCLFVVYSNSR